MDNSKSQLSPEAWSPDALAKRLFLFAIIGVATCMIAILALISSAD